MTDAALAGPEAGAKAAVVAAAAAGGNCGQRDEALSELPESALWEALSASAQWCAPWRRQQNGRRDSSIPGRTAANGPSQRSRISEIESPRRTDDTPVLRSCHHFHKRRKPSFVSGMIES
jgi:hypothetical protein